MVNKIVNIKSFFDGQLKPYNEAFCRTCEAQTSYWRKYGIANDKITARIEHWRMLLKETESERDKTIKAAEQEHEDHKLGIFGLGTFGVGW